MSMRSFQDSYADVLDIQPQQGHPWLASTTTQIMMLLEHHVIKTYTPDNHARDENCQIGL